MRKLIIKIKDWIFCKRYGLVPIFCPYCGRNIADVNPIITGTFVCGECGTKWVIEIVDQQEEKG